MRRYGWALAALALVVIALLGYYYLATQSERRGGAVGPPPMVELPRPAPAPIVAAKPLPVFVPTLVWALEGPAPLRAMRLDRVRRFWGMTGDLRCPTANPHHCVVVHPALGETA